MLEYISADTLAEYEAFLQRHPKGHFLQSSLWAKQKPLWRWTAFVVRDEAGNIRGSLAVMIRRMPLGQRLMYGCRGPVCDAEDGDTLKQLLAQAVALARREGCYALKLDPDVTEQCKTVLTLLESYGFRRLSQGAGFDQIQPDHVMRLDLAGRTPEEVWNSFHSKWRYNIRLAQRRGVEVRRCGREMVPAFGALMRETGVRDGFVTRDEAYFSALLDNLGEHARLYMAFYEDKPIAGSLAICYGDKTWYLYGASGNEHRNCMPNYLLQWHKIQWAMEQGCRLYDFRGVGADPREGQPLYGLYRFKQGFGRTFTTFIGEYDLPLCRPAYCLLEAAARTWRPLRRFIYHRKQKFHETFRRIFRKVN